MEGGVFWRVGCWSDCFEMDCIGKYCVEKDGIGKYCIEKYCIEKYCIEKYCIEKYQRVELDVLKWKRLGNYGGQDVHPQTTINITRAQNTFPSSIS